MRKKQHITCDRCEMFSINGVACHEIGCPNMGARYDRDEQRWIQQRECFECGYKVDKDSHCCYCEECELVSETRHEYILGFERLTNMPDKKPKNKQEWMKILELYRGKPVEFAKFMLYNLENYPSTPPAKADIKFLESLLKFLHETN